MSVEVSSMSTQSLLVGAEINVPCTPTVPTKFVIYRVENTDYSAIYPENNIGQTGRILELLKNATIIKTFDLGISSKIGEYLNTHINDKRFPNSALTINFKEGSQSTFNGIDIVNGGFTVKTEQLDRDYIQVDL